MTTNMGGIDRIVRILIGLALAGYAVSDVGQYQQSQAESKAAEQNAVISQQNAQYAREQAAEDEKRQRIQLQKTLGTMRANVGASGVTMDGTPTDLFAESMAMGEADLLSIRTRGERAAQGYEQEASLYRQRASSAKSSGLLGAVGTLLGGAGSAMRIDSDYSSTKLKRKN